MQYGDFGEKQLLALLRIASASVSLASALTFNYGRADKELGRKARQVKNRTFLSKDINYVI